MRTQQQEHDPEHRGDLCLDFAVLCERLGGDVELLTASRRPDPTLSLDDIHFHITLLYQHARRHETNRPVVDINGEPLSDEQHAFLCYLLWLHPVNDDESRILLAIHAWEMDRSIYKTTAIDTLLRFFKREDLSALVIQKTCIYFMNQLDLFVKNYQKQNPQVSISQAIEAAEMLAPIFDALAAHPSISEILLERLCIKKLGILGAIRNPNTPIDILRRIDVANQKHVPVNLVPESVVEWELSRLAMSDHAEMREAVARNPLVPIFVLEHLATDPAFSVRVAVVENEMTDPDLLEIFVEDPALPVLKALLKRDDLADEMREIAEEQLRMRRKTPKQRARVASN